MKRDYQDADGSRVTFHTIDGWTNGARARIDAYNIHRLAYVRGDLGYPCGFDGFWVGMFDGMLPVLTDRGILLISAMGGILYVDKALMKTPRYMPADCMADESKIELRDAALAVLCNIPPFEFVRQHYAHIDFDSPQTKQNAATSMKLHTVPPRSPFRIWFTACYRLLFDRSYRNRWKP